MQDGPLFCQLQDSPVFFTNYRTILRITTWVICRKVLALTKVVICRTVLHITSAYYYCTVLVYHESAESQQVIGTSLKNTDTPWAPHVPV